MKTPIVRSAWLAALPLRYCLQPLPTGRRLFPDQAHRRRGAARGQADACLEAGEVERRRIKETLEVVAARIEQELALRFGFHAFGDDAQVHRAAELDHGIHDG